MEMEGEANERSAEHGKRLEHTAEIQMVKQAGPLSGICIRIAMSFRILTQHLITLEQEGKLNSVEVKILMGDIVDIVKDLGLTPETQFMIEDKGESTTVMRERRIQYESGESILEEMEKFCTLSQKEHQSNSISDLFNKLRHNIYRIACESDFKLSEVKEAQETDEVLLRISMETEDKTKINLETEETKERDKGSPRVSMEKEEKLFHDYRRKWEKSWSSKFGRCGRFEDTTLLSPMHFTYCAPGRIPYAASTGRTLQFYSIKVAEIKKALGLTWPLDVYGVVAARDNVDRNRNIIFLRGRDDCQTLTQKDPFLRLTGPSRAIVTRDPIHLEIELKAKGRTKSEDRVLMTDTWYYRDNYCGLCTLYTPLVTNLCTIVLSSEELEESVQATIVGVRIVEGSLPAKKKKDSSPPFKYGGRVVCSSTPLNGILPDSQHITEPSFRQVVLQDGAMSVCKDGYLDLARHVVSVELGRRLKVIVYAYSRSGDIAPRGHIFFDAQKSNVSHGLCYIDDYEVEISVAWSCLVREKLSILMKGRV